MTSYGYHWRFTERDGTRHQGSDTGYWERDVMLERRAEQLMKIGWTPARWWQWWRWGDYPRQLEPKN